MKIQLAAGLIIAAIAVGGPAAQADDSCASFKFDVTKEHALFAGSARKFTAGKDVASAPVLRAEQLVELELLPQDQVAYALPPGKKTRSEGAFGGVARFMVNTAGTYRVSVDVPFWIDVIDAGKMVTAKDYAGQAGCVPHKVVEYDVNAHQPLILQASAASQQTVHLTITYVPAGAPAAALP